MFNADKTIIIAYVGANETYNIPDSVTSIGDSAFCGCKNLNPQIKDEIIKRFGTKVF